MSDKAMIPMEQLMQLAADNRQTSQELGQMVQQMGVYLLQLDARLRHQEELLAAKVTISHAQQKQVMAAIRRRAAELCGKYGLPQEAAVLLRKAIRCDLMERKRVKDLHDLPESGLADALAAVAAWDSYSTVRRIRAGLEE